MAPKGWREFNAASAGPGGRHRAQDRLLETAARLRNGWAKLPFPGGIGQAAGRGGPLDLTDANLEWVLVDPNGKVAASYPGTAEIAIWSPAAGGNITVALAGDITADLEIGRHTDALRVTDPAWSWWPDHVTQMIVTEGATLLP
jgi:hypothetical protein